MRLVSQGLLSRPGQVAKGIVSEAEELLFTGWCRWERAPKWPGDLGATEPTRGREVLTFLIENWLPSL